ncbi:MAG: BREX-2 system phosphatase PglZ, partial [Cyanobacteria bacterium J06607_17]
MIAAPTFSQIKAQVTAILQRSNGSKVIGIHAQGRWTCDRQQHDGDQCYLIDQCDSPLALRIALQKGQQERASGDNAIQVLITPIPEGELAEDILIRLVKQRLFTIDSWQIVKSLFRATNIDPRLVQHQWIPEALMDWMPANRYSPVMGGFLDAEIVWPLLMQHGLHLNVERPDLPALLQWSTDPDHIERYYQASEDFQIAVCDWLSNLAGLAIKTVLQCVEHNQQPDALPLGLAAAVVYHPDTQNKLDKAIGKLEERFLAGVTPPTNTMHVWSEAAQQALKLLPTDIQKTLIQRSDTILEEIGAADFAYLSPISEQGFNQYLTDLSKHLITHIQKPTQSTLDTLSQTYHAVQQHQQAILYPQTRRLQRMDMAMRLSQWLVDVTKGSPQQPKSLEDAINYHTQEGSFLDWARLTLPIAEPHRELSTAYGKLFDTVTEIREKQSYQFAKLLKDWTAIGSTRKSVLPVEKILETVVAPLAENHPVLLLVMDGMSMSVAHELISDLTKQTWQLITPNTQDLPIQPGLAAIPSETSVSRASLLCGKLTQGQKNHEKKGFTKHSALLQYSPKEPPLLFHKDALQSISPPILSGNVQTALETDKHQVVGLVINAVDDLLAKGD